MTMCLFLLLGERRGIKEPGWLQRLGPNGMLPEINCSVLSSGQ